MNEYANTAPVTISGAVCLFIAADRRLPSFVHQRFRLGAGFAPELAPVVEAFLHDPNTRAKCRDKAALEALAADMIAATARFLPELWRR